MASSTSSKFTFPHPKLTAAPAGKRPDYVFARTLKSEVFGNAISVHTHRGGGAHGHLGEVVDPANYLVITAPNVDAYNAQVYPGDAPAILVGMTAAQIHAAEELWKRNMKEFETANDVRQELKALIIGAIDDKYIADLKDPVLRYANVTVLELLTYIMATYGVMLPTEQAKNKKDKHSLTKLEHFPPFPLLAVSIS